MLIYIDIETTCTTRPEVIARIQDELEPPATMSKQETIDKWWREKSEDALHEAVGRTALDGGLGEVVCVCIAVDNGQVATFARHNHEHSSERSVIEDALGYVHGEVYGTRGNTRGQFRQHSWCGHNVGFDLKFLWRRCVVLGIKPPVPIPYDDPPWRSSYIDTMQIWAGADNRDRVKLTRICEALGIEVDDDIDGSQVWECWERGDVETIARHCRADVERVRQCYRRMVFA